MAKSVWETFHILHPSSCRDTVNISILKAQRIPTMKRLVGFLFNPLLPKYIVSKIWREGEKKKKQIVFLSNHFLSGHLVSINVGVSFFKISSSYA